MDAYGLAAVVLALGGIAGTLYMFQRVLTKTTDLMVEVVRRTSLAIRHPQEDKILEQKMTESIAAFSDLTAPSPWTEVPSWEDIVRAQEAQE